MFESEQYTVLRRTTNQVDLRRSRNQMCKLDQVDDLSRLKLKLSKRPKELIRRSCTPDANYVYAPTGFYNQEIFNIVWGQTISALSFVYDKSFELAVIQKTINGFRKCAQIAAHYMMSDVFDNIVISLCKFTNLNNHSEVSKSIYSHSSSTPTWSFFLVAG